MLDTRQIHSLTDFLRNHKIHVARIKETKRPEVLTINGKAELVVQDAESYRVMAAAFFEMETLTAIREGLAAADRGELIPVEQVYAEMKAKYGIQD